LRKINDSLIYCSISGYGQGGPHRNSPGHDINYLAIAGALSVPGELNKQPTRPGLPIVDLSAGLFAAFSILASVRLREKTGKGQYIDAAMTDGLISWMSVRAGDFLLGGKMPRKAAEMGHLSPCNAMFQTKDKQKITVGAVEDHFWKRLCEALDLREWLQGEDYATYLMRVKKGRKVYKRLQDTFLTKTRDEWLKILNDAGVPCSPVYSYEETFEDPHIKQRNLLVEIPYGEKKKLKQVVFPIKFSEYTPKIYLPPPSLGEHTEAVLLEAGFSEEEIMAFRTRRAI
jgi:crotonobetainyl-CoA:carnitine CoA-transferase CaiB-like acyl-CoA transferase